MKQFLTLAALVLFSILALAQSAPRTITTLDNQTYEQATITKVEANGITINYDAGIAKIPFRDLSPELQQEFGYNPAKAAQADSIAAKASAIRALAHTAELKNMAESEQQKQYDGKREEVMKKMQPEFFSVKVHQSIDG